MQTVLIFTTHLQLNVYHCVDGNKVYYQGIEAGIEDHSVDL